MNTLLLLVFTVFPCFVLSTTQNEVILSAISSMFSEQMQSVPTPDFIIDESYTPQVDTELGLVTGINLKEAHGFYSVPFAEARAEGKRFQKSHLINNFPNGSFNADVINQLSCYQTSFGEMNMTEDCLVLNIHVPKSVDLSDSTSPPNDNLPVIVWIHGGGFQTGAGTLTLYDGRYLSNVTNALVVSINYRLNAFGFLAITNGSEKICNQGFNDQQLALEWINKFIHNFGGDKDRVTLVGQSAGAQSVMFHLISSKSAPFFHRAIVSSQPAIFQYPTFEKALESTEYVMEESGCRNGSFEEGIECLRNASPEDMLPFRLQLMLKNIRDGNLVGIAEPLGMVLDGEEFTENPIQFVQNGRWLEDKRVAIMGSVIEEFNQIRAYIPKFINPSMEQFQGLLMHVFGDEIGRSIAEKYDSMYSEPRKDYIEILGEVLTDGLVVCPTRTIARFASSYTNAYLYSFSHRLDVESCKDYWSPEAVCDFVFHSTDNIFLFRTAPLVAYNFSETDIQTADQMSYYWGNLAFSENPSSGDVDLGTFTEWPQYLPNNDIQAMKVLLDRMLKEPINGRDSGDWMNLVIDSPLLEPQSNYKEEICDFWDGTKYYVDMEQNSVTDTSTVSDTSTVTDNSTVTGNIFTTLGDVEKTTTGGANSISISSILFVFLVGFKLLFSLD